MSLLVSELIQDMLVGLFREAFSHNTDFTYIDDLDTTGIAVYREYPRELISQPAIIIGVPTENSVSRTFGNDLIREVRGVVDRDGMSLQSGLCYQVFGGAFDLDVSVTVYGRTTAEREKVVDWVLTYLRHEYRSYLEDRSVDLTEIRRDREQPTFFGSELLYLGSISARLFVEWERSVQVSGGLLTGFDFTGITTILPDGSTSD